MDTKTKVVCEYCNSVGYPIKHKPGHTLVGVALLLMTLLLLVAFTPLGILLGLAWIGYGIYRTACTKLVCKACGNARIVPADSPLGISITNRTGGMVVK